MEWASVVPRSATCRMMCGSSIVWTLAHTRVSSLCTPSATVSGHTRTLSSSLPAPVTTTTRPTPTTPSLNPSMLHHPQPQQLLPAPTILRCARCASSHNAPTSHSCHVVMHASAATVLTQSHLWTAAARYAAVLSRWCCTCSVELLNDRCQTWVC